MRRAHPFRATAVAALALTACEPHGAAPRDVPTATAGAVGAVGPAPVDPAAQALGPRDALTPTEARLYDPSAFTPLPEPAPASWRSRFDEPGQTVADYITSNANTPTAARSRIDLQPLGDFPLEVVVEPQYVALVRSPDLDQTAEFVGRFTGLPTAVRPAAVVPDAIPIRLRRGHEQLDARALLARRAPRSHADAYATLLLVNRDLFVSAEQQYAFGYATLTDRLGVMSFARANPPFYGAPNANDPAAFARLRGFKLVAHEVGHLLGMRHCPYFRCAMNGVAHMGEVDDTPLHLCPVCLRKLQLRVGFDPAARYERLEAFYRVAGMPDEARWVRRRLDVIRDRSQ